LKNYKIYYILFVFGLIFILQNYNAFPQEQIPRIARSSEKVLMNGRLYYIHTVQKGQTIYAISRAYGITENEILNENPGISAESISPGLALRIPIKTYIQPSDYESDELNKDDFHYHKVRKKQTLYFISKKYDVPIGIIYKYNDEIKTGLKTGQIIKIPKKDVLGKIMETEEWEEKFIFYTVSENDTLYSISERFGVPVTEIINYNDQLRWGLKQGYILKIPKPGVLYIDSLQAITDSVALFLEKYISPLSAYECDSIRGYRDSIKVALLLPFFSKEFAEIQRLEKDTSLITDEADYEASKKMVSVGANFIEFYEGVLLAVDSLKNSINSIKVIVRDTERDTNTVKRIIRELEYFKPDIIIGPVFPENLKLVASFASQHQIVVVSPLSPRNDLIEDNPFIIQVIPSRKTELDVWADYISQYYDKNIILVHNSNDDEFKEMDYFREKLFSNFYKDSTYKYIIYKEVRFNDTLSNNIIHALSEDRDNMVFISSTNEAYVMEAVNRLRVYQKDYRIKVFGYPIWQTWNNIDIEYLHDLQLNIYVPFYIDYNDKHTKLFINKCRRIYNYEPHTIMAKGYNYCFLGYDIALYSLSALKSYGKYFPRCINHFRINLLLSDYVFMRKDNKSGLENISISILNYNNNLTVNKVNYKLHKN
jgi:LysM repeat protein/ABC-type branched-subunit amino acid transport system substrate-binding protein